MYKLIEGKVVFIDDTTTNINDNTYEWIYVSTFEEHIPIPCPGGCKITITLIEGDYFYCNGFDIKTEEGSIYVRAHV